MAIPGKTVIARIPSFQSMPMSGWDFRLWLDFQPGFQPTA
jgi:hypothetical protein